MCLLNGSGASNENTVLMAALAAVDIRPPAGLLMTGNATWTGLSRPDVDDNPLAAQSRSFFLAATPELP